MTKIFKIKKFKEIFLGILLFFGLFLSAYNLFSKEKDIRVEAQPEKEVLVDVLKLKETEFQKTIQSSGSTEAMEDVLLSPKSNGRIMAFYVKEGDKVKKGDIVARLEKDAVLLASYNNAQSALNNTRASANQDIAGAELAVATAENNLENTIRNSKESLKNAQLNVEAAKLAVQSAYDNLNNSQDNTKQSLQNTYDNLKITMQGNLVSAKSALIFLGNLFGEDPGLAEADNLYADVLGVKDLQSLNRAKNSFRSSYATYQKIKNDYDNLSFDASYSELDKLSNELEDFLLDLKNALNNSSTMLDNTVTKKGFDANALLSLKTSLNNVLHNTNSSINALSSVKQAVALAKLSEQGTSDNSENAYQSAQKSLEKAEQALDLLKAQNKAKIDSAKKQVERAKANLESIKKRANLQISSAQAQINSIQAQLENTVITAPISGVVGEIFYDSGEMAMVGKPLMSIVNAESLKVQIALSEFDIAGVHEGQKAELTFSAFPGEKFFGEVYFVSLLSDKMTKKFPVKIKLDNPDKKIKVGMLADIKIFSQSKKKILIAPKKALFKEDEQNKVYVLDKNKRVRKVVVEVEDFDEENVLVKDGLFTDDLLVLNGDYDLREGQFVKVRK